MIATFDRVAKWYGSVIGLVDATITIEPGVTGLLGPNGAGKSTFLKLLGGQIAPSQGSVELFGHDPCRRPHVFRDVGYLPEQDAFYEDMTGREFVIYLTRLHGFSASRARKLAEAAIERVDLVEDSKRRIRTYSKGMRQRIKLAQAIAHEPKLLILDEPLTGMDPVARRRIMNLVAEQRDAGATVIVSSHILHEVEEMTNRVILMYQGRVRAWGMRDEIRGFLDRYPHKVRLECDNPRELALRILELPGVLSVNIEEKALRLTTRKPDDIYDALPGLVLDHGYTVDAIEAEDVGLDAIFRYLVA